VNRVIERIVDYAAKISDPEEIILFGSMANGSHNIHSDLDLLIVVDETAEKSHISGLVKRYAYELSIAADVLVHTKQEVRECGARPDSFLAGVIASGKIVYTHGHHFDKE
jgi:predicted nucleotidyltransferase